jgi:hypothetical protein
MPIENIEDVNQTSVVVSEQNLFQTTNVIIAGKIKVKHPLMDETLLLLGFVIEDQYFNENNFRVKGLEISYFREYLNGGEVETQYTSSNSIIYPKIIIDKKTNHCSSYFKDQPLVWRDISGKRNNDAYLKDGKYFWKPDGVGGECWYETTYNYYLFKDVFDNWPECATNNIYALSKYKENGVFKHCIFNFHELTLVEENKN